MVRIEAQPERSVTNSWMHHCRRYDPGADVVDDISTESDRVLFLQSIAQSLLVKARMKLNIKRLYQADGAAVRELLKLASLLHRAMSVPVEDVEVRLVRCHICTSGRH